MEEENCRGARDKGIAKLEAFGTPQRKAFFFRSVSTGCEPSADRLQIFGSSHQIHNLLKTC